MRNKNDKVQKAFEELAEALDKNFDTSDDKGHEDLIHDLKDLMIEAAFYEFHDFKNNTYGAPKVTLRNKLLKLAENVVEGRYDN